MWPRSYQPLWSTNCRGQCWFRGCFAGFWLSRNYFLKKLSILRVSGGRIPRNEIPVIERKSSIWLHPSRTAKREPKISPRNLVFETPMSGFPKISIFTGFGRWILLSSTSTPLSHFLWPKLFWDVVVVFGNRFGMRFEKVFYCSEQKITTIFRCNNRHFSVGLLSTIWLRFISASQKGGHFAKIPKGLAQTCRKAGFIHASIDNLSLQLKRSFRVGFSISSFPEMIKP